MMNEREEARKEREASRKRVEENRHEQECIIPIPSQCSNSCSVETAETIEVVGPRPLFFKATNAPG